MKREVRRQLAFAFGRPERLVDRMRFFLVHSRAYYNLVRPLKFLLLKTGAMPLALKFRWLQFLLLPLAGRIKARNLDKVRKDVLRPVSRAGDRPMRELIEKGYTDISAEIGITAEEAGAVADYFYAARAYDSQVPLNSSFALHDVADILKQGGGRGDYFSFTPDVSVGCPAIQRIVRNPLFKQMARDYIGGDPHIYSVNTMLTVPSAIKHQVTTMHRDFDDYKQITFFIYWTATGPKNGATYFVPGSHRDLSRVENGIFLEGRAGSVFAIDTFGLHNGNAQLEVPRLTTWFRFGHLPNFAYFADKNYLFEREFAALNG